MTPRRKRRLVPRLSALIILLTLGLFWNMNSRSLRVKKDVKQDVALGNIRTLSPENATIPGNQSIPTVEAIPVVSKNEVPQPGKHRIVIIGSGPTALGAARRLYDLKEENNAVITILEEADRPGGLASSVRDKRGFLWDVGVHVVFSHYTYFDRVLNMAVPEWNYRRRASFAFMKGSDANRRFIPYPVQNNIHTMDRGDQQRSLQGLEEVTKNLATRKKPTNFDEWLLQKFGAGLTDIFMRKYNRKIWTVNTTEMNSAWVGERVAVPDVEEIKAKIREVDNGTNARDSEWGPNRFFRFPKYNGTGGIWESVARQLPNHWFRFHEEVTGIDIDRKVLTVEAGPGAKMHHVLHYDTLISTSPLEVFMSNLQSNDVSLRQMQELAARLVFTHTHIVGIGLTGQLPETLADKSWVYFPDSDSPFYRVTMFSSYSDDHVPKPGAYWSLMCEIAEPQRSSNRTYWSKENLIKESIQALVLYGFITADMVVSKHYRRLEHGYPVPSLTRDIILDIIQPWLKTKDIYSRGRFGGWRYEVANQDHSFMQGVEAVDSILGRAPEITYINPNFANSKKNSDRVLPLNYELVIAHYKENLDWLKPFADHTLVYHKGNELGPPFQFYSWERLPNVGRESHTYLHHIITFYHHLPDITVFAQGDKMSGRCFQNPLEYIESARKGVPCIRLRDKYREWGNMVFPPEYLEYHANRGDPIQRTNVTFGQMYQDLFGRKPPRRGIRYCWNACFGATRQQILRHPLEFYQKALAYVSKYSNQEECHYLERLWYHFFEGVDKT